jgi:ribose transport system substrate-binding protein
MNRRLLCAVLLTSVVCGEMPAQGIFKKAGLKHITIGMIGKSRSNPVFVAAYAGARVAAKEIGAKYGVEVNIDWQTPQVEDPRQQALAIEQFSRLGTEGIAVACSDASILTPSINKAVDRGTEVVCFDADAAKSGRLAYYGTDNVELGRMLVKELAREMGEKGIVAVLAGKKNAPNYQQRVRAVLDELKKHPSMKLLTNGIYYHEETPEKAAEVVANAQRSNPQIGGWVFIGGWPLWAGNAITWEPGQIKIVASDAFPSELEYVRSGHAQVLIAQESFILGYKSVELLVDKILSDKTPHEEFMRASLTRVTKENLEEWSLDWRKWLLKEAVYR